VEYNRYCEHAKLAEEFDLRNPDGAFCFVSLAIASGWPLLTVAQRYSPAGPGFEPGALFVSESKTLFIGTGERLLAYSIDPLRRLWVDTCETGFWHLAQHENVVLMAAELEFAAWDIHGNKLWTMFVEPPWDYAVKGNRIHLDVMGQISQFSVRDGPFQQHG
jgi:hypothetical protein